MATKAPVITQPPFDKRILTVKNPGGVRKKPTVGNIQTQKIGWDSAPTYNLNIRRGYMVQAQAQQGQSAPLRFTYLYNPSTVEAMYSQQQTNAALAGQYTTTTDQGILLTPTQNTASWTVMFDRTYELWGSYDENGNCLEENNQWGNNPAVVGCWADILQLQWFTGMWSQANGVNVNPVNGAILSNGVNTYGPYIPTGPMLQVLCWAFFGTQVGAFYGAITEWDYTITHYNQFMVPMRCVIDINLSMWPNPGASAKSKTGATGINNTALGFTGNHYYQPTSGGFAGRGG